MVAKSSLASYALLLIAIVIVSVSVARRAFGGHDKVEIVSDVDQRKYLVLNLPDKLVAADQLARLQVKMERFISHINRDPGRSQGQDAKSLSRLQRRFRALLTEHLPDRTSLTSYTIDKGSEIHMCIRDGDKITDENTLFFVALHELAHVMSVSVGHNEEFWTNFRQLLKYAIKYGYYRYEPYHYTPVRYCGTYISDTPLK